MTLAVLGTGLVSPFGLSPRDHVFLGRVVLPSPPRPAFADADGNPIRLYHAPFLDVGAPPASRMAALATLATDDALRPLRDDLHGAPITLALVVPRPRPGLPTDTAAEIERVLAARLDPRSILRFPGETGTFAALEAADAALPQAPGVWIIVAVDSFVSPEYLAHRAATQPRNRWIGRRPHPSEAAAVLVVADDAEAARARYPVVGRVDAVALAAGAASDENDEPTDGAAMTAVVRAVAPATVRLAIGQMEVDALRRRDLCLATAREAARFRAGWQDESLEARFGMLGAAIGGASAAYGLALLRHGATDLDVPPPFAFLAWAVGGDGTRAAASLRAEMKGRAAPEIAVALGPVLPRPMLADATPPDAVPGTPAALAETPPDTEKLPPAPEAAPPTLAQAPPATEEAPPATKEAPPATEEAPPATDHVHMVEAMAALLHAEACAEEEERRAAEARAWERRPPRPLAPDEALAPPPAPVTRTDASPPLTVTAFRVQIVHEILEDIAVRGRSRDARPLASRDEIELSLARLADALLALGNPLHAIDAWWAVAAAPPDPDNPWTTFAAVFALACFDDDSALLALRTGLERLGDAHAHATAAAEALALLPHPRAPALATDLVASPVPAARAVGIDVLVRAGAMTPVDVAAHLARGSTSMARAAIRASARWRHDEAPTLVLLLEGWTLAEDLDLALAASTALLRMGHTAPYERARAGAPPLAHLGPRALDLFVLAGDDTDLARVEAIVSASPVDGALLSALARYGHVGIWAFLLHHLKDEDLADEAEEALRTLLGDAVPPDEGDQITAWRAAITRMKLDPALRYRRGAPWRPSVVADECRSGSLTAAHVEARLAELGARTEIRATVDLARPKPEIDLALDALAEEARRDDAAFTRGWR
ncbi:hypothetical protein [Chondromyces apiculatus]|uniref:Uncharacterized protein n=1 Tax=Chondromyces apiculatus DSM 436 TaxID=1192034 RepID=A0A017TGZ1_9BACT|nr:hypothetical protein [Chondromyces apiculatus]EYF08514.1 Hypothetical protein CAP_4044 [Chondromyces apiculatus DSM 436]